MSDPYHPERYLLYAGPGSQVASEIPGRIGGILLLRRLGFKRPPGGEAGSALIRLVREKDLEQSVVAFDDRPGFARPDIESFLRQLSGAIPPAAAERLEKCGGIGKPCGAGLHHLDDRLQIVVCAVSSNSMLALPVCICCRARSKLILAARSKSRAALSASASFCKARSASETFCTAPTTVPR